MPYNPQDRNRAGEYYMQGMEALGQGIGAFGSEVGDAFAKEKEKREKEQKELAMNDMIIQHAAKHGYIDQEDLHSYQTADIKKKGAIALGAVHNMAEDLQQKQSQQNQQARQAQMAHNYALAQSEQQNAQTRAKIAGMAGQPAYEQPISATQSAAPWNQQVGNYTATGTIHPLPPQQGQQGGTPKITAEHEKIFNSQLKASSLKPDVFESDPRPLGKDEDTKEQVPYLSTDGKTVYVKTGDAKQPYRTMPVSGWNQYKQRYNQIYGGGDTQQPDSKPLDQSTAQQLLKQAGGDKEKARQMAKQLGYDF